MLAGTTEVLSLHFHIEDNLSVSSQKDYNINLAVLFILSYIKY